jgi:hypothetical protein
MPGVLILHTFCILFSASTYSVLVLAALLSPLSQTKVVCVCSVSDVCHGLGATIARSNMACCLFPVQRTLVAKQMRGVFIVRLAAAAELLIQLLN